jgi:hypothetical protein
MDDISQYFALDEIAFGIGYGSRSKAEKKVVDRLTARFLSEKGKSKAVKRLRTRVKKLS